MSGVVHFGGEPDSSNELAEFTQKNGSAEDLRVVSELNMSTIRGAMALWTAGANYADIATQFKLRSPGVAQMVIERALAETVDDHTDRTKLRRRMTLVLDRMLRAVSAKALNPESPEQLQAVRVSLTIVERYARLNGLEAPIQVEVNMPDNDDYQRLLAAAAAGMGLEVPREADIFSDEYMYEDAEVVEDDEEEGSQSEDR